MIVAVKQYFFFDSRISNSEDAVSLIRMLRWGCPALLTFLLLGCVAPLKSVCPDSTKTAIHEQLYFGTAKPDGSNVSAGEWTQFVADVVTPKFPDGFTAWPASGQWRGADGGIVVEDTYVLVIIRTDDNAGSDAIRSIIRTYQSRFHQESVLRERHHTCVNF